MGTATPRGTSRARPTLPRAAASPVVVPRLGRRGDGRPRPEGAESHPQCSWHRPDGRPRSRRSLTAERRVGPGAGRLGGRWLLFLALVVALVAHHAAMSTDAAAAASSGHASSGHAPSGLALSGSGHLLRDQLGSVPAEHDGSAPRPRSDCDVGRGFAPRTGEERRPHTPPANESPILRPTTPQAPVANGVSCSNPPIASPATRRALLQVYRI